MQRPKYVHFLIFIKQQDTRREKEIKAGLNLETLANNLD